MRSLVSVRWNLFMFSLCSPTILFAQSEQTTEKVEVNEKVSKLFQQMRENDFDEKSFPKLNWDDVPSLMELADSERVLHGVPGNPLSLQKLSGIPEGIVALWLVEGIRIEKQFPTQNCSIVDRESSLPTNHPSLHAIALRHYRNWWKEIDPEPVEENAELVPLAESSVKWDPAVGHW